MLDLGTNIGHREVVFQSTTSIAFTIEGQGQRLRRGMTVAQHARASGVAKSCIIRQRKTLSNPSLATLAAQAQALGGRLKIAFVPNKSANE